MPLLPTPHYRPPFPFTSGHLQTIFPTLFRRTPPTQPQPERISTPDGDFLDIDWHKSRSGSAHRLAVVSHGLEDAFDKMLANRFSALLYDTPLLGGPRHAPVHWRKRQSLFTPKMVENVASCQLLVSGPGSTAGIRLRPAS